MAVSITENPLVVCYKCGKRYEKRKGEFPISHSVLYNGVGKLHICKTCINNMYDTYLNECGDGAMAVRQMCRKLDIYWSQEAYNQVERKTSVGNLIEYYIRQVNSLLYSGRCYDDTLREENRLWDFGNVDKPTVEKTDDEGNIITEKVSDEVKAFWGSGYTDSMYRELEDRRQYWMSRLSPEIDIDVGTEAIIRQICSLELDINRDRLAGKPVDKAINALNTLLGSANLKPVQQKMENDNQRDNTPFGVWIRRWEDKRPIPTVDPELEDVDGIKKYVLTWLYGHLAKMLNIKNAHSLLYEKEINQLKVEYPEFEDEDDETLIDDIFGADDNG